MANQPITEETCLAYTQCTASLAVTTESLPTPLPPHTQVCVFCCELYENDD